MKKLILAIPMVLTLSACATWFDGVGYDSKAGLAVISNSERNFVVDYGGGEKGDKLRRCLEAPGPAALLNNFKLDTGVSGSGGKVTEGKIEVDVTNTESISKLYEVSSILQYTHAMSYRLCEAALNGFISEKQYSEKFDLLTKTTTDLLTIQLKVAMENRAKAEAQLQKAMLLNKINGHP